MSPVTRGPSRDHRHPVKSASYSIIAHSKFFSHRLPSHLLVDCLVIRLFVFNLLLLFVWRIFIPTFPEEISVLNVSNQIVTFAAIYPKQLFIVRCPALLFSKPVRSLVELWI